MGAVLGKSQCISSQTFDCHSESSNVELLTKLAIDILICTALALSSLAFAMIGGMKLCAMILRLLECVVRNLLSISCLSTCRVRRIFERLVLLSLAKTGFTAGLVQVKV